MHPPIQAWGTPAPERQLQRVQGQVRAQRARSLPADHEAREHVHDKRDVHPATVRLDVGEVRYPQRVRSWGAKLPRHQVGGPVAGLVTEHGADTPLAAAHAAQACGSDEALDGAARHTRALPIELRPHLVGPVHLAVLVPDAPNGDRELAIPTPPRRHGAIHGRVIATGRDLQYPADRLDTPALLMRLDEPHGFGKRESSSRAKKADAAFRISLVRRNSRFSRSSARIRSRSALVTPGRWYWSTSSRRSHNRSASVPTFSLPAIEVIAAHYDR